MCSQAGPTSLIYRKRTKTKKNEKLKQKQTTVKQGLGDP